MRAIRIQNAEDFIDGAFKAWSESVLDFLDYWEQTYPFLDPDFDYDKFFREVGKVMQLRNKDVSELLNAKSSLIYLCDIISDILKLIDGTPPGDILSKGVPPYKLSKSAEEFSRFVNFLNYQRTFYPGS